MNEDENYAQQAAWDELFEDIHKKREVITGPSGSETEVTYYSDGSYTYHHGGPCGSTHYDKYGNEC